MNFTDSLFSQGGVKTILSGFHNILSQTDPSFTGLFFSGSFSPYLSLCRMLFMCDIQGKKVWVHSVHCVPKIFSPAADILTGSSGFKCHIWHLAIV